MRRCRCSGPVPWWEDAACISSDSLPTPSPRVAQNDPTEEYCSGKRQRKESNSRACPETGQSQQSVDGCWAGSVARRLCYGCA